MFFRPVRLMNARIQRPTSASRIDQRLAWRLLMKTST